ncbi:MAG: chorismate lyase [Methylophilaceae bacterium]|nr:chorismate lyase [Methylophilaceae bacterium]
MQVFKRLSAPRSHWLKTPIASKSFCPWLINNGSLTQRLQSASGQFSVKKIRHGNGRPALDEAFLLGMRPQQQALIREVQLCCAGVPVVFAHSVLPYKSLRGKWRDLGRLGNKPLGGALFADFNVRRSPLEFKKLPRHHALYKRAMAGLGAQKPDLWARRSIFSLKGASIMVTEVFLPQVLGL